MGFMTRPWFQWLTTPRMNTHLGMVNTAAVVITDHTVTVVGTLTTLRTAIQSHTMASGPWSALEQRPWEADTLTCQTMSPVRQDADKGTTTTVTTTTTVQSRPHHLER
jgi:hypothetical protein